MCILIKTFQIPSPLRPRCISPPCFQISPPIFEKISDSEQNFQNSEKFLDFSSAEISDDLFLVIDHKFWISPYFPCFSTFPPLYRENYYYPLLRENYYFPPL